jgi:hypothetical protein
LVLSDAAGTGKTTIAHTVAERCHVAGFPVACFFFDRGVAERNVPLKLFSTIARDLAGHIKSYADQIRLFLERDRSLACASPSRHFSQLIVNPSLNLHLKKAALIFDALDEGCDDEILEILRDQVPELSGSFRIFITTRPTDDILTELSDAPHIRWRSMDILGSANRTDIRLYAQDRLRRIALRKRLAPDWPSEKLSNEFAEKAEGLFIWVWAVSEYLSSKKTYDAAGKFILFLRNPSLSGLPAEAKMDELYSQILSNCDWGDGSFAGMYNETIGSIVALKTPLSLPAINALHRFDPTLRFDEVLRSLSSLFTGLGDTNRPIRMIHVSFRDFVTGRARFTPSCQQFYLHERTHSGRLALFCLRVLNDDLRGDIRGTGYLSKCVPETKGIPDISGDDISEALWYACRFWSQHLVDADDPVPTILVDTLRIFLSTRLVTWMEVLTSKGQFQRLSGLRDWLQVSVLWQYTLDL